MNPKSNSFTKHPHEVGMTYYQHFRFAMKLAKLSFTACFASMVHAVFPFLFVTTTSNITFKLYEMLKTRKPAGISRLVSYQDQIPDEKKIFARKTGS